MKQKRTYVTLLLVLAILGLGIAYAAIDAQQLKVTANVSNTGSTEKIKVLFTAGVLDEVNSVSANDSLDVDPGVTGTGTTSATLSVKGLQVENDQAVIKYTVTNQEDHVTALLGDPTFTALDATKDKWLTVTATCDKDEIAPGATATVTVTVKLDKTPATSADDTAATLSDLEITLDATAKTNA